MLWQKFEVFPRYGTSVCIVRAQIVQIQVGKYQNYPKYHKTEVLFLTNQSQNEKLPYFFFNMTAGNSVALLLIHTIWSLKKPPVFIVVVLKLIVLFIHLSNSHTSMNIREDQSTIIFKEELVAHSYAKLKKNQIKTCIHILIEIFSDLDFVCGFFF